MKQKKCVYCDTLYPVDSEQCPLCGGTYADIVEDVAEQEEAPVVIPVAPAAPEAPKKRKAEPVYEEEPEDEESATPRWMTALIGVVLALALVVGLAFIGYSLGFFNGKDDPDDQLSLPIDQNQSTQIPNEDDPTSSGSVNTGNENSDQQAPDAGTSDETDTPVVDPDDTQGEDVDEPDVPDETGNSDENEEQEPPVDPEPVGPQYPCTAISLSHTDVTLFRKGESFTIKATLNPTDCDEEVVWTSSNEAYATVTKTGKVTAVNGKNNGSVKIIATCGDQKAECIVRLAFAESESGSTAESGNSGNGNTSASTGSYSLNLTDFTMMFNGEQVEVEVKNANLMSDTFVWTIDDPDIASIVVAKDTCIVTAVTSGTTKLHVTINGTVELSCIVRCSKAVGSGAETGAETPN